MSRICFGELFEIRIGFPYTEANRTYPIYSDKDVKITNKDKDKVSIDLEEDDIIDKQDFSKISSRLKNFMNKDLGLHYIKKAFKRSPAGAYYYGRLLYCIVKYFHFFSWISYS